MAFEIRHYISSVLVFLPDNEGDWKTKGLWRNWLNILVRELRDKQYTADSYVWQSFHSCKALLIKRLLKLNLDYGGVKCQEFVGGYCEITSFPNSSSIARNRLLHPHSIISNYKDGHPNQSVFSPKAMQEVTFFDKSFEDTVGKHSE